MEINETVARKVLTVVDAGLVRGVGEPKPGRMCVEAAVCYALDLSHGDDPQCVSRALRSLKIALNDTLWLSSEARGKGLRRLAVAQLGSRDVLDDKVFTQRCAELAIRIYAPLALRAAASKHRDPKHVLALNAAAGECERNPVKSAAYAANAAANAANAYAAANAAAYAANAYAAANAAAYAASAYAAANAAAYAAYAAYAANAAAYAANAAAYAADAAYAANAAAYAADAANAYAAADAANAYAAADAANAYAAANAAAYAANAAANAAAYAANAAARDKVLAQFAEDVVQILIGMNAPGCQWLFLTES
jgi:hypothetical protein